MTTLPTDPPVARIDSLATLVASGFGSGLAPVAPGTAGSVAAALVLVLTLGAPLTLHWTLWLTSVGLAIWSAGNAGRAWGVIDHPAIVIDEVVGFWVAILIPMTLLTGPQSGWVLVMGATGGLGAACIQVAKWAGANVIAGAGSDDKAQACLPIGADDVVN